jgi:hypothetical protein
MPGTPTTLKQAIENALTTETIKDPGYLLEHTVRDIESHVRDFLAQQFAKYIEGDGSLRDTTLESLWERIINHGK